LPQPAEKGKASDEALAARNRPRQRWVSIRVVPSVKGISVTGTQQILFIQGGGAGAHDEWDDKLVESLRRELGTGYEIRYPHA
jgi:hypothetical protein